MPAELSREAYDALPALNWSRLRLLEKSPIHFKRGFGDDSSAFKLGTASHMAVLEPPKFSELYVIAPMRRDKRTKAYIDFEAEQTRAGRVILSQSEYDDAIAIRDAVRAHPRAAHYLSAGKSEVALTWTLGDFACKGRADWIGPEAIVDLKTTQCSEPRAFARSASKFGYFGQAAWYRDGLAQSTGKVLPFVIIAVENSAPHIVTVFRVPERALEYGREQYLGLLGRLDYCNKNNAWGGYSDEPEVDLNVPEWMEADQ